MSETTAQYEAGNPNNTRNKLASHGIEILKWCVLDVLYKKHASGERLSTQYQIEISRLLDIQKANSTYDGLIHSILIRLRDDGSVTYIDDDNGRDTQAAKWKITEAGIQLIES